MDKFNRIKRDFKNLLDKESQGGGLFEGFKVYERIENHKSLYFPLLMYSIENIGLRDKFFGSSGYIRGLSINIDLAFKSKGGYIHVEGERFQADEAVMVYIDRLDSFYENLKGSFDSSLNIDHVVSAVEPRYPRESGQTLWGCVYTIDVYYYDDK